MYRKIKRSIFSVLLGLLLVVGVKAYASETTDASTIYDNAVKENIIDPTLYSKSDWLDDEKKYMRPNYDFFKSNILDSVSYNEWLEMNNYGVMSDTKLPLLQNKNSNRRQARSAQDNINKFCKDAKAGDILIVSGNFPTGVIGHAAIMNSDNTVLEMSGGKGWEKGIPDNNHQYSKRTWIKNHIKDWTSIYRISDSKLAKKVARYVDTNYFSSKGTATRDIHIDYKIDSLLKNKNPNYCSKLVYQAFYYGTGDLPVMKPTIPWGVIPPANLPTTFSNSYKPTYIGRY
ncbi:hypothetical protein ABE867_16855 [Enterococcus gallinarum]|uniref:hypothetical protein n=1 Tax=Enterococcus gallinarum TaxID=1353 RepID=UPI003D6BBC8E